MANLSTNPSSQNTGLEPKSTQIFHANEKDSNSSYLSERAKKLTTAVYIVTNLIPATDPLRLSIRRFSIRLLSLIGASNVGTYKSGFSADDIHNETKSLCIKIADMLEIAFFSGYISEMNFSVLKTELDVFLNEISNNQSQKPINQHALQVSTLPFATSVSATHSAPPIANVEPVSFNDNRPAAKKTSQFSSQISKGQTRPAHSEKSDRPVRSLSETKKVSRRESVISIIKMKGSVSIKDISSVIIDCSEKTIQRELSVLVDEGVLKKSGDRRWSTYSLA